MKKRILTILFALVLIALNLFSCGVPQIKVTPTTVSFTSIPKSTTTFTRTATLTDTLTSTLTPESTLTETVTPTSLEETSTPTEMVTETPTSTPTETLTPSPTPEVAFIAPYPSAPLCPDSGELHDHALFHTLWDGIRGCHYDHEHGTNPFTTEVSNIFPGIQTFLGGIQIGSTNPSSIMENTMKHGGFKWDVDLVPAHGCVAGFEDATYCINSAVIEYHNFGDYRMEMASHIHSAIAFLKICDPTLPEDCGYIYTVQHEEYGQRVTPYQGTVIPYPGSPDPSYNSGFGQYFTIDCVGSVIQCRSSISFITSHNLNVNSIWTSKTTGSGTRPTGSTILKLLFRVRDLYQVFDFDNFEYPFTFHYICGDTVYNPEGCRWNNSTSKVHEVAGTIPSSWDNLEGFDMNPIVGRITAEGFTDRFGTLRLDCIIAGDGCFPIRLVNMFTGNYGDYLTESKVSNTTPTSNPERDIYFCGTVQCDETSSGAVPSGWIGTEN